MHNWTHRWSLSLYNYFSFKSPSSSQIKSKLLFLPKVINNKMEIKWKYITLITHPMCNECSHNSNNLFWFYSLANSISPFLFVLCSFIKPKWIIRIMTTFIAHRVSNECNVFFILFHICIWSKSYKWFKS